ncbi:MBL fold metallo-hydrolase [Chengkuizengella sp. SCS-71B]|uniref:MBL fold metallo-hydrolase n=1 Tax=Chengkuizengella sp. SCS-71B TaxID=3115290 RepID=UPI0032C23394
MKVATGIEVFEIERKDFLGQDVTIHPTVIWDKEMAILIDTGFPGQKDIFLEEFEKASIPFDSLRKIIITHHHFDHTGSLPSILESSHHNIQVLSNDLEKPYIQGEKDLLTDELLAQMESWPEQWRNDFKSELSNPPKTIVHKIVTDGEELPYCGGIIVINTPGHSIGHISLYHKQSKTLIAADAMVVQDGLLELNQQSIDIELSQKSLRKFTQYDIETVICYHGGLFNDNVNERIAKLVLS